MKPLFFHPDVTHDVKGAYEAVSLFPKTWSPFEYGFKRYILSQFPFSVIYKEEEEKIYIIAVMHNSRKPNYWLERLETPS